MKVKFLIQILGYLGLVPFLYFVWLAASNDLSFSIMPSKMFVVYSGIILTFLAGAMWGTLISHLRRPEDQFPVEMASISSLSKTASIIVALATNIIALVCWLTILISDLHPGVALTTLMAGFVCILWIELGWHVKRGSVKLNQYLKMRAILTAVVCTCHLAMLVLIR